MGDSAPCFFARSALTASRSPFFPLPFALPFFACAFLSHRRLPRVGCSGRMLCLGCRQRLIAFDRRAGVEQHALAAESLGQPGMSHDLQHAADSSPPARRRRRARSRVALPSISACNAEYSMSGTRLMSSASTRGLCCATSASICSATILRVDEEEASLRPHDQQALEGLVVGVFGRQRSQHIGAALAADDVHARVGSLARPDRSTTR